MRYALTDPSATPSLIYPLEELQDRISLEVPASYIKEESIRESADQNQARLQVVWYRTEDNKPDGQEMNVAAKIEPLVKDVMENKPVTYDIMTEGRSRNTFMTMVTLTWPSKEARVAAATTAADIPFTFYVGENVFSFETDGNTYSLLKNGEVLVDDLPSLSFALGVAVDPLKEELGELVDEPGEERVIDFLSGAASTIIDSEVIPEAAKEAFVTFFELTTNKDLEAVVGEDEED